MWKLQKNPGESSRSSSLNSTFFCGPPHQRRSRRRPDPRSLSPANRVTVDSHMFSWGEDDESLHFWHLSLTLRPHPSHHRCHSLIPSRCQFPRSYKTPPTRFRRALRRTTRSSDEARRRRASRHDGLTSRASRRAPRIVGPTFCLPPSITCPSPPPSYAASPAYSQLRAVHCAA